MPTFFDKFFRGQNTRDKEKSLPQQSKIEKLIDQIRWTGTWSDEDRQNLSKMIETIDFYLSQSGTSSSYDLVFVKGCAELELGLTSLAIATFDSILEKKPDHFGAQVLRDKQDPKLSILRRPIWDGSISTIPPDHPTRIKRHDVLLPVRDGIHLTVSSFLGVERDRFPVRIDPDLRSGVQLYIHHTPFGNVPTLYYFFDTHSITPFVWEQCLHHSAMFKDKDPFTLVTGLIRQMMVEDFIYLIPFDMQNGHVLINRKHPIQAVLRKQLTDAAVELSKTFSTQTDATFLQAINWIGANFEMKQLQWGTEHQQTHSPIKRSVTTVVEKPKSLNKDIDSLVYVLTHPERLEGPRITKQFGVQGNPDLMTLISIPLIETEASRKHRIAAAHELGKIGSVEAGKALAESYSQSKENDDVKNAIGENLRKVLTTCLQRSPGTQLLPPEVNQQLDKAGVLFQQGVLQFSFSTAGEKALPFIILQLSNGNLEDKVTCLSLLGKLRTDEAANILLQNISSTEHRIRTAAVNALAECSSPLATIPLQEMLNNESDKKVRRRLLRAVLATVKQGTETVSQLEIITKALVDPDLEARKIVTELLYVNEGTAQKLRLQLGDGADIREKMCTWLRDPDMNTHYTAIRGLAILGMPEDKGFLESARRFSGDSGAEIKKAISMIRARELS